MVSYQNITEIQIVKDQTISHRKSILTQFGSEVQNRQCTLEDNRFSLKFRKKHRGGGHWDGPENTSHEVQKAHILNLGTKMAQLIGEQESQSPALTVSPDINRQGAHQSDAQVF